MSVYSKGKLKFDSDCVDWRKPRNRVYRERDIEFRNNRRGTRPKWDNRSDDEMWAKKNSRGRSGSVEESQKRWKWRHGWRNSQDKGLNGERHTSSTDSGSEDGSVSNWDQNKKYDRNKGSPRYHMENLRW